VRRGKRKEREPHMRERWERDEAEKIAGATRERKAGGDDIARGTRFPGDGEKLWSKLEFFIPQKYCSISKTVVLNT
jgi:hypothetical protein